MSQQVITTPVPSIPRWRGRSIAVIALVVLLAAGAGVAVGALLSSDSTVTDQSATTPAPDPAPRVIPPAPTATWSGNALLAVVTAVPGGDAHVASLTRPVRQMINEAADAVVRGDYVSVMPDTETLFGVLTNLGPADRAVILGLLPPEADAEFAGFLNSLAGASTFG